jgi:SAM-dependent methyltransferase
MHTTLEPSPWVRRFAPLVTAGGAVLDIACGGGRHLRLFAAAGHPVTGIDRDLSGLADLASSDLAGMPGIELIQADLEDGRPWPLPSARRFAAVIVTNYLYRPLLSALPDHSRAATSGSAALRLPPFFSILANCWKRFETAFRWWRSSTAKSICQKRRSSSGFARYPIGLLTLWFKLRYQSRLVVIEEDSRTG